MTTRVDSQSSALLLADISDSLLQPLLARAYAHRRFPQLRFRDIYSELILQALFLDVSRRQRTDRGMYGACLRARWIERQCEAFLRDHPRALGVTLGAGLDTLYLRLCDGMGDMTNDWYDVDSAEVIALKQQLLTETNHYRMLAADICDENLFARLPWAPGQAALFVLDGVLMYLEKQQAMDLIDRILKAATWRAAPVTLLFDFCSPFMAKQSQRRNSKTRQSGSTTHRPVRWSMEHPSELRWLSPDLEIESVYDLTNECGGVTRCISSIHRCITGRQLYGCVRARLT